MQTKIMVRNVLIRALALLERFQSPVAVRRRVLALHQIGPEDASLFREKLRGLISRCHVVSLADLYFGIGLDPDRLNVALTFDDGYLDHLRVVAPVLREHHVPATFFISSGVVGLRGSDVGSFSRTQLGRRDYVEFLGEDDVKDLAGDALFDIGGHTVHHEDLGPISDVDVLEAEIVYDKEYLESLIGRKVRWFAYPFGRYRNISLKTLEILERAQYTAAFTIVPSFWSNRRHRYLVGRDSLSVGLSDTLWASWQRGGYDVLSQFKEWRAFRRLLPLPDQGQVAQ